MRICEYNILNQSDLVLLLSAPFESEHYLNADAVGAKIPSLRNAAVLCLVLIVLIDYWIRARTKL